MNISRWEPFREMEDLLSRFEPLFLRSAPARRDARLTTSELEWMPAVDITETENEFKIEAELPEVEKKDVKIEIQDGHLAISGERTREKEDKDEKVHRVERYYGRFSRTFALPENVDTEKAEAECKDGVLRIRLPKRKETPAPKAKQIPVQ